MLGFGDSKHMDREFVFTLIIDLMESWGLDGKSEIAKHMKNYTGKQV
jgi:hypothetical protein